jgi:hypothetical protein
VREADWARNPIDRFVLAKLEEKGWTPAPPATPHALLRRVYFDLIGLPPTPEEQAEFLRDPSPEALDRVVEELLARPQHGERWARHWLDLVRFAESNGYERDATKPNAWRYRDYVIRALNADTPFDRFLAEQLAGDELPDTSAETLIATGYYRLGPWDDEPADPEQDRFDQLDDLVSTTAEVFLGLTLGCARCHDHKFEPLTMSDYYGMAAIFAPLERPRRGRTELDLPAGSRAELAALAERDRRVAQARWNAVTLGPFVPRLAEQAEAEARRLLAVTPDPPRGYFLREPTPDPSPTHLLRRGRAATPGPAVEPGVPAVLAGTPPEFLPPDGRTSRRRLSLARWLARPDHPLTARVIVNRVWQFHFGEGLVRTPSDFGTAGEPPTHPELLDWLADRFVADGWSLKRLHRLILASNAYRMGTRWDARCGSEDPDDRLLWRRPYRRLEVEAIRDAMLAVSGRLNPAMYGPSIYPAIPTEAIEAHADKQKAWTPSGEVEASRRTIYAFVKRTLVVPMFEVLDFCDTTRSSPRRPTTSVAPQALTLLNGEFTNDQAAALTDRLVAEVGDDPAAQVERAYRLALCRPPTAAERAALLNFMEREAGASSGADARRAALRQACRVVFNLNEFVYPD